MNNKGLNVKYAGAIKNKDGSWQIVRDSFGYPIAHNTSEQARAAAQEQGFAEGEQFEAIGIVNPRNADRWRSEVDKRQVLLNFKDLRGEYT